MKNKIIAVTFITALLGNAAFAQIEAVKAKNDLKLRTTLLEKQLHSLQKQVTELKKAEKRITDNFDLDLLVEMYAHGPAVVTSPALGVRRSADDASDLMVNLPSINEDLVLLDLRQKMDSYARKHDIAIPSRPIIALSGGVEGQISHNHNYNKTEKTDINLSSAELHIIAEAGPAATAAMIVSYDDDAPDQGTRVSNSRLKIGRAFLTIGQLEKCPLYFTIGQVYAPFGSYGSHMISDSSIKKLGRVKDRMIVLGYKWQGLQAQVYAYPGETKVGHNIFAHTGVNLGYEYIQGKFKLNVAGSLIGNLAESDGMQSNVFANTNINKAIYPDTQRLNKRISGIDGRFRVSYHPFTVLAEYVGAIKPFDKRDLTFNGNRAKPQALNVEGGIEFEIKGKPNNFAVGYGRTWDALALKLPKNTFFAEYDVSLLKNTILSFEYRHDINYGWDDQATGAGDAVTVNVDGRHKNSVIANLAIYF